jgi:hypothetical protein
MIEIRDKRHPDPGKSRPIHFTGPPVTDKSCTVNFFDIGEGFLHRCLTILGWAKYVINLFMVLLQNGMEKTR